MLNELPDEAPPELVVGVDFGMTQTGVAYSSPPWNTVKTFQHWSGNVNEISNKVPSRVAYDQSGRLKSWGFGCDLNDETLAIQEHFKLYLDPEYSDDYAEFSCADAQKYFFDFMVQVHDHLVRHFQNRIPHWQQKKVEWNFSVPTTWRDAAFIASLERLIQTAGFGTDGPSHVCRITLTEAEAAAISVASQYIEQNDVLLVCDAGGGTTDVNILKLMSPRDRPLKLAPLSKVEGKAIGSALIDIRMQQILEKDLTNIASRLRRPPSAVAEQIMMGRFERFKCNFGSPGTNVPYLLLDVPDLPPNITLHFANVINSQIAITSERLQQVFDEQVNALVSFVADQIHQFHQTYPGESANYIILSGGLGSSPYVQSRLHQYLTSKSLLSRPQILAAEEPQLSVVMGLVQSRCQQLNTLTSPISNRKARVSYGVVVNLPYNPKIHNSLQHVTDPRDGKKWLLDQIDWLIREGDPIPPDGLLKQFRAKIDPHQLRQPWHAQFVMCNEVSGPLPTSLADPAVRTLCVLEADISHIRRLVVNGHWWNLKQRYELAVIDVRVVPGSADLRFEVWNEGRRLDGEREGVGVRWEERLSINPQASPNPGSGITQYSPNGMKNDSSIAISRVYGIGGTTPAAGQSPRQMAITGDNVFRTGAAPQYRGYGYT